MAENTNVELSELTYDHADYTALRAYCLNVPPQRIADLYCSDVSPQLEHGLWQWLPDMHTSFIERAIKQNPGAAHALDTARQGCAITTKAYDILIQVADLSRPVPIHRVSRHA